MAGYIMRFFIAIILYTFFMVIGAGCDQHEPCTELTILYSANSNGKLQECGCPNDPFGGYLERATMLERREGRYSPMITVDAGNMISLYGQYKERTQCILDMMDVMNYDVAGIGKMEMFHGRDFAEWMKDAADFPLISSSVITNDGEHIFKPYVIEKIHGCGVGITSVWDSTSYFPETQASENFTMRPFEDALASVLPEMQEKSDFIIILSHLTEENDEYMASNYPAIDLIVSAGHYRFEQPKELPNAIIVQPGDRGQFIGLITLSKTEPDKPVVTHHEFYPVIDYEPHPETEEILDRFFESYD